MNYYKLLSILALVYCYFLRFPHILVFMARINDSMILYHTMAFFDIIRCVFHQQNVNCPFMSKEDGSVNEFSLV